MADTAIVSAKSKSMTIGEGGTALALTALAFVSLVVAAKAYTPEYALHAYLFTAASAAAVIAIVNRYYERPATLPPLTIDGKPNYNMGPVKFATLAAVVWGWPASRSDFGRRSNLPFRRSTSTCPGSRSAASARCTPRR